ncbi:hypothetical protein SCH01S_42_00010 [Sphingomonas changbaiensis NBRC 104936]|uniref:Uncharacterized protein n=1 Tax=Sphingomonas changbaiensis NBRC 104936 TaxID=1219043 RepID=A0A0E9MQZ1_9SPHN|nr:hypothetical protein SCH01S_42_00010 [Sphingomonas changbaiensis NBRC 104936]
MLSLVALVAAAALIASDEPLARQLRASIWNDLQLNAWIGNGAWIASLWYNAGSDDPANPDLHIQNLACRSRTEGYRCTFVLSRDGGVKTILGEPAPDRLTCDAIFVRAQDGQGWAVKHLPPRHSGHSRTSMRCKSAPA